MRVGLQLGEFQKSANWDLEAWCGFLEQQLLLFWTMQVQQVIKRYCDSHLDVGGLPKYILI